MSLWRSNCPLAIAALLATSLLHAPVAMATEPASRPNVIFILADDLGWSDTSLNGQTRFHQTPNLNRLAQRGWKTRGCTADVNDGIATIQSTSDQPFLGFALGKIERGARLRFRIKSMEGRGSVAWLPSPTADSSESPQPVEFKMKNEKWQGLEFEIPAPGDVPGIVRLFLPTQNGQVEVDWIELETVSTPRRWDF